jgi:hypothetical protein
MKAVKTIFVLVCVMMVGICVKVQAADEGATPTGKIQPLLEVDSKEREWKIMYGLKAWANEWSLPLELGVGDKTQIFEFESDTAITPIPAFLATYRNFFIGGSYLLDTDYDFPSQQYRTAYINDNGERAYIEDWDFDVFGSRKEWDVNIGYFITPNIAISLGYKNLEREVAWTFTYVDDSTYTFKSTYPLSVSAPIIGISASAPVSDKFNLYGNLAYGWLSGDASYNYLFENERETTNLDVDGNYLLGELGFGYVIPLKQKFASAVTINAGYRFQRLNMTFSGGGTRQWGKSGDQHDSTAGFILGVGATY